jgi:signal transduction histidine kinase
MFRSDMDKHGNGKLGAWGLHELKNALQVVKSLVFVAARDAEQTALLYGDVKTSVDRMERILRAALVMTPSPATRAPVKLEDLARSVVTTLGARAGNAGVALSARLAALTVEGDGRRLHEAVLNLVGNAIEATPPGGQVELTVAEHDGAARIEVRDTGRGIPPTEVDRLGTEAFTTREDGSGLGVLLTRTVIDQHGGSLVYQSEVGTGTVARITLPLAP